jgi:hypothetical protein
MDDKESREERCEDKDFTLRVRKKQRKVGRQQGLYSSRAKGGKEKQPQLCGCAGRQHSQSAFK